VTAAAAEVAVAVRHLPPSPLRHQPLPCRRHPRCHHHHRRCRRHLRCRRHRRRRHHGRAVPPARAALVAAAVVAGGLPPGGNAAHQVPCHHQQVLAGDWTTAGTGAGQHVACTAVAPPQRRLARCRRLGAWRHPAKYHLVVTFLQSQLNSTYIQHHAC